MNNEVALITALGGVAVAIVSGLLTWLASRGKTRVAIQETVYDGFRKLVSDLQEEVERKDTTETHLRGVVASQDSIIYNLHLRIRKLAHIVTSLHNFIVMNGLHPPPYVIDEEKDETPPARD